MRVFEHAVVPTASPSAAWREQIPGLPEDQIPLLMGKKIRSGRFSRKSRLENMC
jgi:hypothetical protein